MYKNYSILTSYKADKSGVKMVIMHMPSYYKAYGYSGFDNKYSTNDYKIKVSVPTTLIPVDNTPLTLKDSSNEDELPQYSNAFDMNICPVFMFAFLKACMITLDLKDENGDVYPLFVRIDLIHLLEIFFVVIFNYLTTKGDITHNNYIFRLHELLDDDLLTENDYINFIKEKLQEEYKTKILFINNLINQMFEMTFSYYTTIYKNYQITVKELGFPTIKNLFGNITENEYDNYFVNMIMKDNYKSRTFEDIFRERKTYNFISENLKMTENMPETINFKTLPYIPLKTPLN